ncbi:enolase C-terminal domain-like protein [Paenibacillus sacheonensis]|uniref:Mandelate racemase n=1 Tax=Paenibacillus sacheonensis TaxID=742054 RepID=A0A7X4YL83_9BACL|nr:enolase C-terminal domain-like protein [Paenibacillus sacheonensis]MBM7564196.1 mannonate dehydratase [Paenibacillus sacheonensis]NBC67479.1 mandelate racemase [Paenibacillus sacheonensis]
MAKIKEIRIIRTRRDTSWTIVKVVTDQPGLYGIGSASDIFNPKAVIAVIEELLAPMLIGQDAGHIEDIWQQMHQSGYWRSGSALSTAMGGIDMALWDIKGKEANMPVYKLLGGPCRAAVPCYAHAAGNSYEELEADVQRYLDEGYRVIRCQLGAYGGGGFVRAAEAGLPEEAWHGASSQAFDEAAYLDAIPEMFRKLRDKFGYGVKLTHDVHEHLTPTAAVALSKLLEPYRLFFLEDVLPPDQIGWFANIRKQSTTPQAIGELFTNPHEWVPLIKDRLIDFIRVRVSKAGGITQCRKIAALGEAFGVRTAWQEGGDNDPVNQAAAMHLDLAIWNFGIQEENHFRAEELAAFPGHAVLKGGYLYANDKPGLGIDIDEEKAEALVEDQWRNGNYHNPYPIDRQADGTIVRP